MTIKNNQYRKLSAIMFTDMVGYSAMVQENESKALELLQEHRILLRPIFKKHDGNEVETAGDSFFVEFNSALQAALCAIEIQTVLHDRNMKVDSDKHIKIRIGLHVGDVVHLGEHVHGDGVNIAARMEPMAAPGGICLSEDVYRQIHNKIEFPLNRLGTKKLKNIKSPINIYSILLPWITDQQQNKKQFNINPTTKRNIITFIIINVVVLTILFFWKNSNEPTEINNKHRIAVLPLLNISQDSDDDYFADGMTEELISQFAKISGLSVIARTSVLKYKNTDMNISEIGKELNVGTILEGSVRKALDKARITVQLIDVDTQEHIWSQEYDRDLQNIFEMQSDISFRIAEELKIKLAATEEQQIKKTGTINAEAFRLYLLGKQYLNKRTGESIQIGLSYFKNSIELDPKFALAYVGIADCYTLIAGAGFGSFPQGKAIDLATDAINTALSIDETLAEAYNSLAYLQFRMEWDWISAENNFKKAIELKPSYASAYEKYSLYLATLGRYEESLSFMKRAFELDPLSASVSTGIGRIYDFSRQYDKAINQYKKTLEMNPDYVEAVFALGLSYSHSKNYDKAIPILKSALEKSNGRLIILASLGNAYARNGMIKEALAVKENLIQQQSDKNVSPLYFALIDAPLGNTESALDSLYKAYEERSGILVYLKVSPFFERLNSEPRYNELLKLIGLEN